MVKSRTFSAAAPLSLGGKAESNCDMSGERRESMEEGEGVEEDGEEGKLDGEKGSKGWMNCGGPEEEVK